MTVSFIVLRLPLSVKPIFLECLERTQPLQTDRVLLRIRSACDGNLTDGRFGSRMRRHGEIAGQIERRFKVFAKKYGLDRKLPPMDFSQFRPPRSISGQMSVFWKPRRHLPEARPVRIMIR